MMGVFEEYGARGRIYHLLDGDISEEELMLGLNIWKARGRHNNRTTLI